MTISSESKIADFLETFVASLKKPAVRTTGIQVNSSHRICRTWFRRTFCENCDLLERT